MKTKLQFQKTLLFLFLLHNILVAQSENNSNKESYILTYTGEKIPIEPNRTVISYKKKISCVKPIDKLNYHTESISIESKNIEKIIDGDRIYIPVKYNPKRICLARVIAKKNDFILISFNIFSSGKGRINDNGFGLHQHFGIINSQNEIIEERNTHGVSHIDKKYEIIKKYFGKCIEFNEETLINKREYRAWSKPKFLKKPKIIKEKTPDFLWNINQLECLD